MATEAPVSYIDTLLKRVAARGNLGVRFESGAPVRVTDGGAPRDVTNRTLSSKEIMAAIGPMIRDVLKRLPPQPSAAFAYDCAGVGGFNVAIRREGDKVWVSIDPSSAETSAPPVAAPPPPPPPAPVAEPELIIETTSVSAAVSQFAPAPQVFVAPVEEQAVVEIVMTPAETPAEPPAVALAPQPVVAPAPQPVAVQ